MVLLTSRQVERESGGDRKGRRMVGQRLWYCLPSQSVTAGCLKGAGAGPRARGGMPRRVARGCGLGGSGGAAVYGRRGMGGWCCAVLSTSSCYGDGVVSTVQAGGMAGSARHNLLQDHD